MPRPKKPASTPPAPAMPASDLPPSKTTHLFGTRPATRNTGITRERIAADLEAFREAGGKIEVLGVTRSLKKIDPEADATPQPAPAKPRR